MSHDAELARLERSLKGAPTGVYLALILRPGSHTAASLQLATGYSPKAIRQALGVLEMEKLVYYDRPRRAWLPVPDARLLKFLRLGLNALAGGEDLAPATAVKDAPSASADPAPPQQTDVSQPRREGEKTPLEAETPAPAVESVPPGAPNTTTASDLPDHADQRAGSKQEAEAGQRELRAWLARGGIGRNSPKMRQLLAAQLDPDTVKAHVLERLACEQGLVKGRGGYAIGLLIRRLEDGDAPPPMRCEACLQLPDRLGMCRCDYDEIVRR